MTRRTSPHRPLAAAMIVTAGIAFAAMPLHADPAPPKPQGELDMSTPLLYEKAPAPKANAQGVYSNNMGGGLLGARATTAGSTARKARHRPVRHRGN